MSDPRNISIDDYDYPLPPEKIASFPSNERADSKLVLWKAGKITEDSYKNIARHLLEGSLVVLNNTKVLPARIIFEKPTGAHIEIFCLEPYDPASYQTSMDTRRSVLWKCMIGGASKWKEGGLSRDIIIDGEHVTIEASLKIKLPDAYVVQLSWTPPDYTFSQVLDPVGSVPLPPYIKRDTVEADKERYQTIYAQHKGSVAAPTAGLHFTEEIFSALGKKNIKREFVTLHVGAGTFKPVKAGKIGEHEMHSEWMEISADTIRSVKDASSDIIAVGTTSLRVLESLYWIGLKIMQDPDIDPSDVFLGQWEAYELDGILVSNDEALTTILKWLDRHKLSSLTARTQIMIAHGYTFRIINALITNFHQPRSTLLLLVAAMVGNDWKRIYDYALRHKFRFLSYGDGCLIQLNDRRQNLVLS